MKNHQFREPASMHACTAGATVRRLATILMGLALTVFLVIGCGGWAVMARLDGAIITSGIVKVDQNLKEVQHRDGGIVKTLAVRPGDFVSEGQVLVALDDVQVKAELLIVRAQLAEALARKSRLLAERDNLEALEFAEDLRALSSSAETAIHGENRLFSGNKAARDSQKEQLELSIGQTNEEINGLQARLVAKRQELKLVGAEREKLLDLHEKSWSTTRGLRRPCATGRGYPGRSAISRPSIARAKARASEIRLQIIAIDQNARTEAQRELRTVDARLAELNERKLAIDDRLSRTEIRSPVSGYVNELSIFTIGGVITPAAKIATIVPHNAELKFEAKISPADIDQVREGQQARVRLTAFIRNTTPEMKARVVMVSPASARDPSTGQEYYIAYVELEKELLSQLSGMRLVPGMPAEVFISTAERTAASYLVKPFTDQMNRAFRER